MTGFRVTRAGAILAVADFTASLRFYRDQLGLEVLAVYDDPPYATLTAAGARISLAEQNHPAPDRPAAVGRRTFLQVAITTLAGIALPLLAYVLADAAGLDLAGPVYLLVVCGLVFTAVLIWAEGLLAFDPAPPPQAPQGPYPPASAVIAAYLPNEAATVVETVEAMLRVDYPGPFQVVLAYNTPQPMPVEAVFAEIAARDPRFVPYRVQASTSKAQNVNAALSVVTGEFVGVFDADHHPDPGGFGRAWRWLSHGYDVVQGHCVVRNGDASWVARTT